MSSTTVSVPKYRHHKGSGQAFVQVNGRRHYLGKWDSPESKERYAAFVAELAVCPTAATPLPLTTPASQITVVELCAAYLDFAEGYYRKNGQPTRSLDNIKRAIRAGHRTVRPRTGRRLRPALPAWPSSRRWPTAGSPAATSTSRSRPSSGCSSGASAEQLVPPASTPPCRPSKGSNGPHHGHESRSQSCRSTTRWLTPRCPTCPPWWPIWSVSSG